MAQTFIGRLVLRLQQNATTEGRRVEQALHGIENAARRLGNAPWGRNFQRQLDRLRLSPNEMQAVLTSWDRLQRRLTTANLTPGGKRDAIAEWRTGTLQHFSAVRADLDKTERRMKRFSTNMRDLMRPAMVALGGYTGWYLGGEMLRGGLTAGSERERVGFRMDMAGVNLVDQVRIAAESQRLSHEYRSVNQSDIMQLALNSLGAMGDVDRVIEVLETLVQTQVTRQSTGDVNASIQDLAKHVRGIDVSGQNEEGQLGIEQIRRILEGWTRASQIEGQEINLGDIWTFARRGKIASSAFDTEFWSTVAPVLIQDMGAPTAGAALSSAYQSFVIGSSSTASYKNLDEQKRLGLRVGTSGLHGRGELVGSEVFGTNPYRWVQEYLVPALAADGVNMSNDVAVNKAIALLSRNTHATSVLTRMVLQQPQIEKNLGLYAQTMGLGAADIASEEDPFVAWKGFLASFENLAGALSTQMEIITPALNKMTDLINALAGAVENNPDWAVGLGAVGVGAGGLAAWGIGKGIFGLITAGTQLQLAATMLQGAAGAQGVGGAASKGKGIFGKGIIGGFGRVLGPLAGSLLAWEASEPFRSFVEQAADRATSWPEETPGNIAQLEEQLAYLRSQLADRGGDVPIAEGGFDPNQGLRYEINQLASQIAVMREDAGLPPSPATEIDVQSRARAPGGEEAAPEGADYSSLETDAQAAGQRIRGHLSVTAEPTVNTSSIDQAISKSERLLSLLGQVGTRTASASRETNRQINNLYTDYGVQP